MTPEEPTLEAVRRTGAVVPHALGWLVDHGLLMPESEPQLGLEPWFLCPEQEVMPISKRWPGLRLDVDAVPFARAIIRGDELACLVLGSSEVIVVEYEPAVMPPLGFKVLSRFEDFGGWLRHLLNEVANWIAIMGKRGLCPHKTNAPEGPSLEAIRRTQAVVPHALVWLVRHGLLVPHSEPQLGLAPWYLCPEQEIMPISRRWQGLCFGLDAVPFARRTTRGDELACLVVGSNEVIVIEYDSSVMSPNVRVVSRFDDMLGWLRATLDELVIWIETMGERGVS